MPDHALLINVSHRMAANNAIKLCMIVCTFSLLYANVQSDQRYNSYVMFNLLEGALLENKTNIYQLKTEFCIVDMDLFNPEK